MLKNAFATTIGAFALIFLAFFQSGLIVTTHAGEQPDSPLFNVTAETANGPQIWRVELASDDNARSVGLMFRKSMPKASGMLFRFEKTDEVFMWMKNTLIPLDMVFATETGKVSHIHRSAEPGSLSVISSNGPVRYVLEINAGEADLSGLRVGSKLRHPWFRHK